ncbi:MAG: P-loop NTPase fold protein [Spirochaetota bacterium]
MSQQEELENQSKEKQVFLKKIKDKLKSYWDKLKLWFLLTALLAILHKTVEKIITKLLVDPVLSEVQTTLLNDIIIMLIGFYLLVDLGFKIKRRYTISLEYAYINLIGLITYSHYRFYSHEWLLIHMKLFPSVGYLDILFLFFGKNILCNIFYPIWQFSLLRIIQPTWQFILQPFFHPIWEFIWKPTQSTLRFINSLKETTTKREKLKGFFIDIPVGKLGEDSLNRKEFIRKLIKRTVDTDLSESAFAIGITSKWGTGKTSFLDLCEREILETHDSTIIIKYNPWQNQDSTDVITSFFKALNAELGHYSSNITDLIQKYADVLVGMGDKESNRLLKPLVAFAKIPTSVQQEFARINEIIGNIDKKIVIFIDDLDRLHKDEVLQVLKLIRNTASFCNTIFFVAFDRNYVVSAIEDINAEKPEQYIEKIFQLEIPLPKFEEEIIREKLKQGLLELLNEEDKKKLGELFNELNIKLKSDGDIPIQWEYLTTLREVSRFLNSFALIYDSLQGEVLVGELINLMILQMKYPKTYEDLYKDRDKYINKYSSNIKKINLENYKLSDRNTNIENKKDGFSEDLLKELEKIREKIGEKEENDFGEKLLKKIFSNRKKNEVHSTSILHSTCFNRYFHIRLLSGNISEVEFSDYFQTKVSWEEFKEYIDSWLKTKSANIEEELYNKFKDTNPTDLNTFEKVFRGMLHLAHKLHPTSIYEEQESLFGKVIGCLIQKVSITEQRYTSKEDWEESILIILEEAKFPYLVETKLIYFILKRKAKNQKEEYLLHTEKLEELRLKYFTEYITIERANLFDQTMTELFHFSRKFGENSARPHIQSRNPKIIEKFKDLIIEKKALDNFLSLFFWPDSKLLKKELFEEFFDPPDSFKTFIDNFNKKDSKFLTEFEEYYKKLKDKDFQRPNNDDFQFSKEYQQKIIEVFENFPELESIDEYNSRKEDIIF